MPDETKPAEEKKPEPLKPISVKAKVVGQFARGSTTVEHKDHGTFNVVTAFDQDPPEIGKEIDVTINSIRGQVVEGRAINTVEHAVHVRPKK